MLLWRLLFRCDFYISNFEQSRLPSLTCWVSSNHLKALRAKTEVSWRSNFVLRLQHRNLSECPAFSFWAQDGNIDWISSYWPALHTHHWYIEHTYISLIGSFSLENTPQNAPPPSPFTQENFSKESWMLLGQVPILISGCSSLSLFFKKSPPKDVFIDWQEGKERERSVASHTWPEWGWNQQPGYVPWRGFESINVQGSL